MEAGRRVWVLALALLLIGCGGESARSNAERVCLPGETRLCNGPLACQGAETCEAGGQRFGACDCGTAPVSLDAGAPGVGRSRVNQLAARCETDGDCGVDLACWPAAAQSFYNRAGGAAGGYCTAACVTAEDCTALDPLAVCGDGLCHLGCFSGEARPGEGKCLDRADVTCWSGAALGIAVFNGTVRQSGLCLPACGSDEDCGGRSCDLAIGLCVDTATPGAPIGAACDSAEVCAGRICQQSAAGPFFCTAPCTFGTLGCGYGSNAEPREAMCLVVAVFDANGSEGLGDVGLCLEVCDGAVDCSQSGWQCVPDSEVRGRSGYCAPALASLMPDAGFQGGPP